MPEVSSDTFLFKYITFPGTRCGHSPGIALHVPSAKHTGRPVKETVCSSSMEEEVRGGPCITKPMSSAYSECHLLVTNTSFLYRHVLLLSLFLQLDTQLGTRTKLSKGRNMTEYIKYRPQCIQHDLSPILSFFQ